MDKFKQAFLEEAQDLLEDLSSALLELENDPQNLELVDTAFRSLHTIKGSGSMFGFDTIASFTHTIETVYDLVRSGRMKVSPDLISQTLAASDIIRIMVKEGEEDVTPQKTAIENIFNQYLEGFDLDENQPAEQEETQPSEEKSSEEKQKITFRVVFKPDEDILLSGTNPLLLLRELEDLGQCTITTITEKIPLLNDMNPEKCYFFWQVLITTSEDINTLKDVFIFVEDSADIQISVIDDGSVDEENAQYKKLGDILVERGEVEPEEMKEALGKQKRIGEVLVDSGTTTPATIQTALEEQQYVRKMREQQMKAGAVTSLRVASDKVDKLVDLVGELVTLQAGLSQFVTNRLNPEHFMDSTFDIFDLEERYNELARISEEAERLTTELRDNTMSIRMVPIGTTFNKFKRVVRDLSKEMGKEVDLITTGGETELDKTVIERIGDPLVHMIRNCVDHGIEGPDDRSKKDKPSVGTIRMSAAHSGAHVVIRIEDDGAGMDKEKIRTKAIEKGLIAADAHLTDKAVYELIFEPGFSTAEKVTNVSGRGVGMDVVKRNIVDDLRGTIDVTSELGTGTTVAVKLPLTLAIIDSLLVKIKENYFVLPLANVEECVELKEEHIEQQHGKNMAEIRGHLVPYIRLREQFVINGSRPDIEQVVVCEIDQNRVGFAVDTVVGSHQTVIKPLGSMYKGIKGVSGATILGDGTVALILDVPKLAQMAEAEMLHETAL